MNKVNTYKTYIIIKTVLVIALILLGIIVISYFSNYKTPPKVEENKEMLLIYSQYDRPIIMGNLERITDEYSRMEGNPKVIIKNFPKGNFQKELSIARDKKNLPDIIIYDSSIASALVSMNVLQVLNKSLVIDLKEQYYMPAHISTLVNGKSYGIPLHANPYIMLYNKDFVDLSQVSQIETLEDLKSVQRKRIPGTYNFAIPLGSSEETVDLFYEFIYSNGGSMANVTSDSSKDIYEWLDEMKTSNLYPKEMINWTSEDLIEAFAKGSVNICFVRSSSLDLLKDYNLDFTYRVGEIPYSNRRSVLYHGMNIGISQKDTQEKALDFIKYITQDSVMERYLKGGNVFSAKKELDINNLEKEGLSNEFLDFFNMGSTVAPSNSMWFSARDMMRMTIADYMIEKNTHIKDLKYNIQEDIKLIILQAD